MERTALTIVKKLQEAGYETYFAGGCVRDILLKREPQDYDIVTSAKPDKIEELLEHTIPVGKEFGIIMTIVNGHKFEIATFREDSEKSDGRRPHAISFSDAEKDAKRRDFTINGMFYDPVKKEVIDHVGGQNDLNERVIRFIGDAEKRIKEDHLRIIRAVRFKNALEFQYHPKTFQAIKKHSKLIKKVSAERLRDELNKIICIPHALETFEDLDDTRILEQILPEIGRMKGVAQPIKYHQEGDVWTHSLLALESLSPKAPVTLRWAVLLHDVGKPDTFKLKEDRIHFDSHAEVSGDMSKKILKRLAFSRKDIEEVNWLVRHHMMMSTFFDMTKSRKKHWYQNRLFKRLLRLMKADIAGSKPSNYELYDKIVDDYKHVIKEEEVKPLLMGKDLVKRFKLEPSPLIGEILMEIEKQQLAEKIHNKKEAWDIAKKIIEKRSS